MIAAAVVEEIIPGAVLLIAKDGKVLHEKAFGYAQRYDYGKVERSEPVSMASNQIFDLASLTKVFSTTFGLMILVDEKKVDLEELGTNTHSAHLVADIERRPADLGRVSPVRVAEHFREVTHE